MNYYIQGCAAKADKIRAAFEKLGYDVTGFDMCNDNILFFTYKLQTGANVISTTNAHIYTANIIKTHPDFQELELHVQPKFKVGDWIAGIDDEGDVSTEKVVSFSHNKVLLLDTDGCQTEYPKTELSNFHLWTIQDAKDGDVLTTDNGWTCIFKAFDGCVFSSYCFMDSQKWFCEVGSEAHTLDSRINGNIHPATKEQRILFFKKMQEAGYQWDADKKELKKIKPHYDIANFKPKQWVLVRQGDGLAWRLDIFSHLKEGVVCQFECVGNSMVQCIPFEGNEHLLGTTDMPDEMYINW